MPMSAHCDRHEPIVIGEMFMVSIGVSYQSKLPASGSVDRVQVAWLPALIEPRFQRAIQSQYREPSLAGHSRYQLDSLPAGGSGPNQTVVLPSALVWTVPLWLLTLGNGVPGVCSSDRVCGS